MADSGSSSRPKDGASSAYKPSDWAGATRRKGRSINGIITFVTLRFLDLPFQYWLLSSGAGTSLVKRLGGISMAQPTGAIRTPVLGLSPYHTLIFSLAVGSSLKQIYWNIFIQNELFHPNFALFIAVYNTLLNAFNTLLALWAVTSQQPHSQDGIVSFLASAPIALQVGIPLYITGLFVEWYSEIQRQRFKADPRNAGKPYAGGLFGLARSINYGGYTLWRTGYSLICGGWIWGTIMAVWLAGDFCARAIPSMDAYCQQRYGEQWGKVKRKVPYKLLPWIY